MTYLLDVFADNGPKMSKTSLFFLPISTEKVTMEEIIRVEIVALVKFSGL